MTRLLAALLAVNGAWFATLHVCWALGWRYGIPPTMPSVRERPWFLAYDLAAAAAMLTLVTVAAAVCLHPPRAARGPWRLVLLGTAAVCGVRGVAGLAGDITAVRDATLAPVSALADGWFVTTALLAAGAVIAGGTRPPVAA